jgi:hypothetical protein
MPTGTAGRGGGGMTLSVLEGEFGVARLGPRDPVPAWSAEGAVQSVTRTREELSVVCSAGVIPEGVEAERGWRCLQVRGPLAFSLTGILSSLAAPLADAGVSILAISTYETDYILVPGRSLELAVDALRRAGHSVEGA